MFEVNSEFKNPQFLHIISVSTREFQYSKEQESHHLKDYDIKIEIPTTHS